MAITELKDSTLNQVEDVTDSDGQPNLLQKQKSWHQRRREEILRLREEVRELTRTLQHQQDISRLQGQLPIAGATCGSLLMLETSTPRNMLSLWESMAKRELASLQVSSDENLRLRELVRQHELQMKTLQHTFKRRLRSIASVVPSKPSLSCPSLGPSKRNGDVFVELLGGLDELYGDLDNCFKRVKADEVPCQGRREDSMKYQDGNICLQGDRATGATAWQTISDRADHRAADALPSHRPRNAGSRCNCALEGLVVLRAWRRGVGAIGHAFQPPSRRHVGTRVAPSSNTRITSQKVVRPGQSDRVRCYATAKTQAHLRRTTAMMSSLLTNDDAFLMDESSVLAFLADCEVGPEPATVSTNATPTHCDTLTTWSDSTSSVGSPEKPVAAAKKKTWRQRRKEEVLHLREVVKQLSAELERLKMAAGVQSTLPTAVETAPKFVLKAHKTEASVMWENIAGRQSTLRQKSEDENAKLREAVALHLQQAKSLQRAIKRKLKEDLVTSSMDLMKQYQLHMRGVTPPLNNKAVFDRLLVGLDEVYEGVDTVFEEMGMNDLPCPGRKNNTAPVVNGMTFRFIETSRMVLTPGDLSVLGPTTLMRTHREAVLDGDISVLDAGIYPSMDVSISNWEHAITRFNNSLEDQLIRAMN
ncbi:unnamed protein product [Phytophthora lilii]|uniref:Unnamed protein product n=1 Tax=Phytophthora lilii TaxID=2077276 RepID=A0A9W6TF26_9STRA|nr:unnamed protein product [Phytophthora lilii]